MKEKNFKDNDFLFINNSSFIQQIYKKFLQNPASVDQIWQEYFKDVGDDLNSLNSDYSNSNYVESKEKDELNLVQKKDVQDVALLGSSLEYKIARLIMRFRKYSHLIVDLDPLKLQEIANIPVLTSDFHGIKEEDHEHKVKLEFEPNFANKQISEIINKLHRIYNNKIAYEFEYITNIEEKLWFRKTVEGEGEIFNIADESKKEALNHLHRAVSFEQLLHKKFPGAKRFSVEGGEAIIPALEKIIKLAAKDKILDIELGMAHRGRLNVLTNVCHKPYDRMVAEFKGGFSIPESYNAMGDVKYHMGHSATRNYEDGHNMHISLAYNPSHLEAVNPVVAGKVRAKQDFIDSNRKDVLAVLIHGDASFMGQGSVAELFNMAYVDSYNIGGTIHFVINNQLGFTANNCDSRSTKYCSDVAKFVEAPIIHINGNDVEALLSACILAFEYRKKFSKDIVIDIVCFRKYGHNEGDEPNYTQPIMYNIIKKLKSLDEIYAEKLIDEKIIDATEYKKLKKERNETLEKAFDDSEKFVNDKADAFAGEWAGFTTKHRSVKKQIATGVEQKHLKERLDKLLTVPSEFNANKKLKKQFEVKKKIFDETGNIDWALGESLSYATLLEEKKRIRITGQDAKRGTFSHRHSVLRDMNTEEEYIPLNNLSSSQGVFEIADSVLSEYAVLGFEYGYSLANPNCLTIWEGQFGDFCNGAQIIIDQFIASGETKWLRLSGLVMLLPHGYEGQGPEHSSAKLERFLQLCADDNMQVANCTTPANFFHILRRQLLRDFRKPLIIMTPKSLLRNKSAISHISELDKGTEFLPVISETKELAKKVRKLVFCSGKIYYDLLEARKERGIKDIALVRIEEFYPYPEKEIFLEIKKYQAKELIWCQEEPENMGAWHFLDRRLEDSSIKAGMKQRPKLISRKPAASPATGYMSVHKKEQVCIIDKVLS